MKRGSPATAGYPQRSAVVPIAGVKDIDLTHLKLVGLIFLMIVGAGLTCGPGAGWLAEIFPTRIRYTALSVPYHLTSAWFGGFMPLTAAWLVARSGDVLIAASVSGNSPNLVKAYEWAKAHGVKTLALVGAKRGRLAELADQVVVIEDTHYGRVEDVQMHILHILCYAFMEVPGLTTA